MSQRVKLYFQHLAYKVFSWMWSEFKLTYDTCPQFRPNLLLDLVDGFLYGANESNFTARYYTTLSNVSGPQY
jgi:hypothetical protein